MPPFDGVRPYQKIPFQYSLHIQQEAGTEPEHFEYLAQPKVDPRRELIEQLLAAIPADACVLTATRPSKRACCANSPSCSQTWPRPSRRG
ncbi:MAG: DUF2779 domain-containing protein [Syntrophotaleaceae bacterium]